uniref:Uncharacterized protein n=2 Tax=Picea TaxID=3328 RepID=A0A101LYC9_PICGL|nr:hypothetical protein ABT39_MTgene5659 [Picea glauca]QHR90266.1 hypothetical protein Q903MT_gene4289 [Picea sitchensis]
MPLVGLTSGGPIGVPLATPPRSSRHSMDTCPSVFKVVHQTFSLPTLAFINSMVYSCKDTIRF